MLSRKSFPPRTRLSKEMPHVPPNHWQTIARQWELLASPLRPAQQDVSIYQRAITQWALAHGPPRALILGVTPELYHLSWPRDACVEAIDKTPQMIEALWPGPRESAVLGDWTEMVLELGSRDIALCDGGLALLAYPHDHGKLLRSLDHILSADGICVFRMFVPPRQREAPGAVLRDLLAGKVSNPNVLKLRLAMALQQDTETGVQFRTVWDTLHQVVSDLDSFATRLGWPPEPWRAINSYRECSSRFHFVSVMQFHDLLPQYPGGFTCETIHVPTYELGERCPLVVMRRGSPID